MLTGLVSLFQQLTDFRVLGTVDSWLDIPAVIERLQPDVLLIGTSIPDDATVDAIRAATARSRTTRVVVLANAAPIDALMGIVGAGAAGYMLKAVEPNDLIAGIRAAAAGGASLDPASTQALLDLVREFARSGRDGLSPNGGLFGEPRPDLSDRERTIAHLIAAGLTNRQIGGVLMLSPHTVKSYVSQILKKLGASHRAAIAALDAGLLDEEPLEGQQRRE